MHSIRSCAVTLVGLVIALPALAAPALESAAVAATPAAMPQVAANDAAAGFPSSSPASAPAPAFGVPIAAARLDEHRGGSEVSNVIVPNGYVQGNAATNVITGSNAVSDGAFSSASGFPTAIQNTGANVLIQNAMIVNVQIQ